MDYLVSVFTAVSIVVIFLWCTYYITRTVTDIVSHAHSLFFVKRAAMMAAVI